MSTLWSTIIGAVAAIVGGVGAAWWQTRRADDIARRIRREERREQALFALSSKVQDIHSRLAELVAKAKAGPFVFDDVSATRGGLVNWESSGRRTGHP